MVLRFAQFAAADSAHTRFAVSIAQTGFSPLLGDPSGYVTWIDADDAATAVVAALHVEAGTWNVAEDHPATRATQAEALARVVGRAALRPVSSALQRMGGAAVSLLRRSLRISNRSFREAADWAPTVASSLDGWAAALDA